MGLFSKRQDDEPSYSRQWIAEHGPEPRKAKLAVAILKRLSDEPVSSQSTWGTPLEDHNLQRAIDVVANVVTQDRSLARHVARDVTLFFEDFGGLTSNHDAALQAAGPLTSLGESALAIARVIAARSQGYEASSQDLEVYRALYEDASAAGHDRAVRIAAWSGTVTARLRNSGYIPGDIPVFEPWATYVATMSAAGWYPNPVNAGDTSTGDAAIQRWWDGTDWTDRVRVRDGRHWTQHTLSLLTVPNN